MQTRWLQIKLEVGLSVEFLLCHLKVELAHVFISRQCALGVVQQANQVLELFAVLCRRHQLAEVPSQGTELVLTHVHFERQHGE